MKTNIQHSQHEQNFTNPLETTTKTIVCQEQVKGHFNSVDHASLKLQNSCWSKKPIPACVTGEVSVITPVTKQIDKVDVKQTVYRLPYL